MKDYQHEFEVRFNAILTGMSFNCEIPSVVCKVIDKAIMHHTPTTLQCSFSVYKGIVTKKPADYNMSEWVNILNAIAGCSPTQLGLSNSIYIEVQECVTVISEEWNIITRPILDELKEELKTEQRKEATMQQLGNPFKNKKPISQLK